MHHFRTRHRTNAILVVNDPALRSDIVSLEVTSGKLKAE